MFGFGLVVGTFAGEAGSSSSKRIVALAAAVFAVDLLLAAAITSYIHTHYPERITAMRAEIAQLATED